MAISQLVRGSPSAGVQIPVHDPIIGGDARLTLEDMATALATTTALSGASGGLPDGDLGDVTKSGETLTVPGLSSKAELTALDAKADLDDLQLEAQVAIAGSVSGAIDTSKQFNPRQVAVNTALAFSGVPAVNNTYFGCSLQNTGGADVTITIPASFSMARQTVISTFTLRAGGRADLLWCWDGATYRLWGEPGFEAFQAPFAMVGTVNAGTYPLIIANTRPLVITGVSTRCASGTAALTALIDAVPLGGAANAVSSTLNTQGHGSANQFLAGDDLSISLSAQVTNLNGILSGYYL
jgi:hypothetical protein